MITYQKVDANNVKVLLEGSWAGNILKENGKWHYKPKGSKAYGDSFATVEEVKRSLEDL